MDMGNEKRTEGVTPAERHLGRLCARSFLRLWSYSGVCRNQNTGHGNPQGKEVCDLLVVFGKHLIIFSDKDCAFSEGRSPELAWSRWAKKTIFASARQIYGAERWITCNSERLYTDLSCSTKLPIRLPPKAEMSIHRIIVAHGAGASCAEHFQGSRGSLMIDNTIEGERDHYAHPYRVGHVDRKKGFVHILDDVTLDIVLKTLDTISDFVAYLEKKEAFLSSSLHITAAGEEELLGHYLKDMNHLNQHDFLVPPDVTSATYTEGQWDAFEKSPQRKAQIIANRPSYTWDELIEKFVSHSMAGTHRTTTQQTIADQEILYHWLAREPRTRRRMLSNSLLGLIFKTPAGFRAMRLIEPSYVGDPFYIFLVVPFYEGVPEADYRAFRERLLGYYCHVLKLKYPRALDVVGIATEAGSSPKYRSEDLIYMDLSVWNTDLENEARALQREFGLMTNTARFEKTENEYPDFRRGINGPLGPIIISRNKRCPCQSGKRYGKCHGKAFYEAKRGGKD